MKTVKKTFQTTEVFVISVDKDFGGTRIATMDDS